MPSKQKNNQNIPAVEACFILDAEAKQRVSTKVQNAGLDARKVASLLASLTDDALATLLAVTLTEAIDRKDEKSIALIDQWIQTAKQTLNATEEMNERRNIDTEFMSALNQLS